MNNDLFPAFPAAASMTVACASLLRRARGIAGSIEALARYLHVPKKQLGSWIDGDIETPRAVFVRAVDFLRDPPEALLAQPQRALARR